MFYLIRPDGSIACAESQRLADARLAKGWVLTTRERYVVWWHYHSVLRLQQLIDEAAARCVPLLEQEVGTHYSF